MKLLIRLAVLGLAAFGAKTLYDRWYGQATTSPLPLVPSASQSGPYLEEVRVELEEVVAAPFDPELGVQPGR